MEQNLFTPRQLDVLVALGNAEGDIDRAAAAIKISPNTLRVHLTAIAHKLGTSGEGRSATLIRAHRDGYIKL